MAYDPWRLLPLLGCRGEDWGDSLLLPGLVQPVGGCCEGSGALQDTALNLSLSPAHLLAPRGLVEGCNSPLHSLYPENHCLADCWGMGLL